jgi:cytochrome c-type biogenesis protein CcmH/NrfG
MKDALAWLGFLVAVLLARVYPAWFIAAGILLVVGALAAYAALVSFGRVGWERSPAEPPRHARVDPALDEDTDADADAEWFATPNGKVVDRNGRRVH